MAENDIVIDKDTFHTRLSSFLTQWKNDKRAGDNVFGGADSISLICGKSDNATSFTKSNGFQFWLFGYEFPSSLLLLTPEKVYMVTTKKKAAYLEPLQDGKVAFEILERGKDNDENQKIWDQCLEIIKAAGKKVGVTKKPVATGNFADEWYKEFEKIASEVEEVEIPLAISTAALAVKDEKELRLMRDASRTTSGLMRKYFVDEMAGILDKEQRVTHRALAERVNRKIDDTGFLNNMKVSSSFDASQVDWAVFPIVQSGGTYNLKLNEESDDENLHAGVIIAAFGIRYQMYSSLLARTFLVDPNKEQETNYKFLVALHEAILKEIRDGVTADAVYKKAISLIQSKRPELEKHFPKVIGYGLGLEERDATLALKDKSTRVLKDGMTLMISTGFSDLDNPKPADSKSKKYSLLLVDTIRVAPGDAIIFTKDMSTDFNHISFFLEDDDEDSKPQKEKTKEKPKSAHIAQNNIQKTRLRNERTANQDNEKESQRREHQRELHAKKQKEGLERFNKATGALNGVEEKKFKRFESYKRDGQLPSRTKDLIICVDQKNNSVVVPIMGRPVPFHINTIKNASRTDEGKYSFLRINLLSPGQGVARKDDQPFEDPDAHFIRSLTFRSKDMDRMANITEEITEMKKLSVRKEQEKKELEDVVEQDKLVEIRGRRPHRMEPIFMRPALEGKRLAGSLEIHQNGLRYNHPGTQKVDILFDNIKHLFFQPCDHELIVIIHVNLVNPIMIGKRKAKDVQFYREATQDQFDETGNRKRKHRYGDEEEFEQEQEERRRRAALNKEFKTFTERISEQGRTENVQVDMPFRELGFNGVPARSNVLVQPTTDCLVQLSEPPFLCVTLSDLEVVHLERVQFGLKNFDMVLVYHDFNRIPQHINTIPVEHLDAVKDWLDSVDIPFTEGPLNLNWTTIMKTVQADPHQFFADGGWAFLSTESDDEGESEDEDEESAFEIDDSEVADLSQESSEDDSEFDDDASDDAEDEEPEDLSEEGEDWDELEEKAKKKDKESGLDDDGRGKGGRRRR